MVANCWELATLTVLHWNGTIGVALLPSDKPFQQRVAAVSEPASSAGFRPGDRVDVRELYRADGTANPVPGVPYRIIAHRGVRTIAATIVPAPVPLDFSQILRLVAVFWLIAFASLIAVRGAPTRENALLLTILLALAMVSALDRMVWPDSRLTFVAAGAVSPIFWYAANISLVLYAACFGRPLSAWRALLSGTLYVAGAFNLVQATVGGSTTLLYPWIDPNSGFLNSALWGGVFIWYQLFLSLLCVAAAIPAARPDERRRLGWVAASFTPYLVGVAVGNYAQVTWGSGPVVSTMFALQNASFFFIPAGLTYAALAKRMFDVGFVINRAAVFAGVSIVVVGAFVLVEWALGKWFENVSHATSLAVNAGLALVLGFSIRFVHGRIDAAVDNVFFRKRHENETALRRFAREAAFFTDGPTLIDRTRTTILAHSEASSVQVLLADDLDLNDAAVVAMRAWHEPVDLTHLSTSLHGDTAFPMLAHGALVGTIVCGSKKNGERYAPDEIEALSELARGVGLALDGFTRNVAENASLARIAETLSVISSKLDDLRPGVISD